jgi:hypothetical protein
VMYDNRGGEKCAFYLWCYFVDYESKNMVVVQTFSLPFGLMVITKSEVKKKNSFVHQVYRKLRQPWCCVIMDGSSYK